MTAPQRQALNTSDLWRSVDRLTKDRTPRLIRDDVGGQRRVEHVKVPSLWTQMREAIASSNSSDGRTGKSTGSRSPLDLAIEALLADMSAVLRAGLVKLGHRPRVLVAQPRPVTPRQLPAIFDDNGDIVIDPDLYGRMHEAAARSAVRSSTSRIRHDVLSDLRQYAAAVVATNDQAIVNVCERQYASWVWRAEEILTGDDEAVDLRGIRGHACPKCEATFVERVEKSADPRAVDGVERFHDAALVISFRDGQVQHVTCRACGAGWWRGGDVDGLSAAINETTNASSRGGSTPPAAGEHRRDDVDRNAGGRLAGLAPEAWWPWPDNGGSAA